MLPRDRQLWRSLVLCQLRSYRIYDLCWCAVYCGWLGNIQNATDITPPAFYLLRLFHIPNALHGCKTCSRNDMPLPGRLVLIEFQELYQTAAREYNVSCDGVFIRSPLP